MSGLTALHGGSPGSHDLRIVAATKETARDTLTCNRGHVYIGRRYRGARASVCVCREITGRQRQVGTTQLIEPATAVMVAFEQPEEKMKGIFLQSFGSSSLVPTLKSALSKTAMAVAAMAVATSAGAADYTKKEWQVVGTWASLENYKQHELPYWTETLPQLSDGAITANMKDYTNVGMSGFETMRLLKLGTFDAVHALTSYTAQDAPALEGIDLAGVIQDFGKYREAMTAYKPIIERELKEKFNAKMLMLYTFPKQQFFCNFGSKDETAVHLADLEGRKLRTYSTSIGDFIEGLGASAVTLPFAEVVPALQKGVADCGATGVMPAYNAKWYQVVTHNVRVNIGFAATFLAINFKTWDALSPDTQKLMTEEAAKVEDAIWESTQALNEEAALCNTTGPCEKGEAGGIVPVELNEDDLKRVEVAVNDFVLARWAKRCGKQCAMEWNDTIGKVMGVSAPVE